MNDKPVKVRKNAHLWARHPEDWYVEEQFCNTRLFEAERFDGNIIDVACGSGRIVKAALAAGYVAHGTDKVRRSDYCWRVVDFMEDEFPKVRTANFVSNPPFGISWQYKDGPGFVARMIECAENKVAALLPARWMFGDERSRWIETQPLARVYHITPRPSMPPGPVVAAGIKPENGKEDFIWLIFERGYKGEPAIRWLHRDP